MTMENILDYQESEPYLEAQQYIERMKQEDEGISMKSVVLDVSDHRPVGLDVSDHRPVGLDVSDHRLVGLDVSDHRLVGLDESDQRLVDLDVSDHRPVGLDESDQRLVGLDVSDHRLVGLDVSDHRLVGLDVSDHSLVGLDVSDLSPTVYPVAPLSHATVQWDAPETPETPTEPPPPGPHPELDYADGPAYDWTLNLPSTDLNYIPNQDGVFDWPAEAESEEDDRLSSSQACDPQNSDSQTQMAASHEESSTSSAHITDSRADVTEEHFDLSDGAQILMDTKDSEIGPAQASSQSQEQEEPGMLVLPRILFTHEWTETEANGESVDARAGIQDPIEEPEVVEKEESSPPAVQSDQSQNTITDPPEPMSDLTNGSVDLEESTLTQEPDKMSTSVTATEMSQSNDIHGLDRAKNREQLVNSEQKVEPENGLPAGAQESEPREPVERVRCPDEQKPCQQTPGSESSDQTHAAEEEMTSEQRMTSEEDPDTNPVGRCMNVSAEVGSRAEARRLAERLYRLDGFQCTDVVRHLDKDNEFSRAVGEEYLKFFDFTNQTLEQALRSFLKVVVLTGETQERERVLQRFSSRFQHCNPEGFSSGGSVLTLTCAVMLLNSDLHGQNVGKSMSMAEFVSNLDGMNGGENFSKDCLKSLYSSIKSDPLQWAVEDEVLAKSLMPEQDLEQDGHLRSKSNPFQDLPHDRKATVFQKGFLKRKAHADIDGKRTPWGKRSWKTFYALLKGMVLYLQKDDYGKDCQSSEEVVSVHHALAERALNYTKRPHVFRLQTADWRVFLFEAASTEQMNSWIGRINLVSALHSSPPFPAAVGSQKRFCRPILPATQSNLTLEKQLQSHGSMLQSFQQDLCVLQEEFGIESRKSRAREQEELRQREEYLQYEKSRYEVYIRVLEAWQTLSDAPVADRLMELDEGLWTGVMDEEDKEDPGMKRSHSSPSLELETPPPPVVKVRRNISERRTYRKIIIPRRNKEI
ncbi:PH and SEC7 domain-containing protein 2 isoform X2 [Pimephales promelas]|uniref:PH and SEC7 domain-containing protein 2 isoform X2 n=1 Tax=Pimephales promelas TaxID=90988 RepID=UPI001955C72A|nr:PH and SEC7 domain-containing protein 2 isoform X2 [Pimephales promelas]KAG1957730.1 PH and SEC7 domain-containing protein 1-like [Pimephales promelas]